MVLTKRSSSQKFLPAKIARSTFVLNREAIPRGSLQFRRGKFWDRDAGEIK